MKNDVIEINKQLCIEKFAGRCSICGSSREIVVRQLNKNDNIVGHHLSNLTLLCYKCNASAETIEKRHKDDVVGVVLCGGKGSRLMPLTLKFNKHLLPLALSHMISYPIRTLRHFGVKRVLIILDQESGGDTISVLGSGKAYGMDFSYKVQSGAAGISDALYLAKDFAKTTDKIMCILGDNIFDNNLLDTNVKLDKNKACVWLKEVDNPNAYGVASITNGMVTEIVEKPSAPKSNLAVVGLYMYDYSVFKVIESAKPSGRGELEISDVNDAYAKNNQLSYNIVKGYWGDAGGSLQRYAECSMHGAKLADVSEEEIDNFKSIVFDSK